MIIYEAYNKANGKSYIGLTTKSLKQRVSQHLRSAKSNSQAHFHKAIRKYGAGAFEWHVVMVCGSLESLHRKEQLIISLYEPNQLYNKSLGGEHPAYGLQHSDATKEICREAGRLRWEGNRAGDKYPSWVFSLGSYAEAKQFGVPKTTWYRHRKVSEAMPQGILI